MMDTDYSSRLVSTRTDQAQLIALAIKLYWKEIRYCYESELEKDPNLEGKVAIKFVIDGSGSVSAASVQQDTMSGSSVASCMVSRVQRWRFPAPRGGGQVIVTYPWVFRSSGTGDE